MDFLQAFLPLLGLLAAGGAIGWLAWRHGRTKKAKGLPTDPLCGLFVNKDDKI